MIWMRHEHLCDLMAESALRLCDQVPVANLKNSPPYVSFVFEYVLVLYVSLDMC